MGTKETSSETGGAKRGTMCGAACVERGTMCRAEIDSKFSLGAGDELREAMCWADWKAARRD